MRKGVRDDAIGMVKVSPPASPPGWPVRRHGRESTRPTGCKAGFEGREDWPTPAPPGT